ncbi:MAG TPA: PilN domain-containing protein [Casimicrobiaceae bacterium]
MTSAATNWRGRVRESANRAGLPRFWRWWMGELAPLLPGASRAAFQRRFARPVIELAHGEAVFWRPEISNGAARLAVAETVALTGDAAGVLAAGRAAVARLAANASGGIAAPKIIVALDARQVLRKQLSLPAAVEENLTQALAYDLDRHTPFRPEQLYFDATVIGRDAAKKTLRVDWVAALKSIVDGARKQVEDWGAVVVAVVPGPPTATTRLNLLPDAARPRPWQWRRWEMWVPLALVATFALAAVLVPLVQKRQYAIALNALSTEAGAQAQVADKLRQELERMENDYNYILAKKYAYPSTVVVLDEVTRVLPDDTWITQLELKTSGRGKEVQRDLYLRGESANAGKLIALLEDSKLVELVAPRSPTTRIQGSDGEIFDLGARLRRLPPPSRVAPSAEPVNAARPVISAAPAASAPAAVGSTAPVSAAAAPAAQPAAKAASATVAAPSTPAAPDPAAAAVSRTTAAGFGPFPDRPVLPPPALPPRSPRGERGARQAPPTPAPPAAAQSAVAPQPAVPVPVPPAQVPAMQPGGADALPPADSETAPPAVEPKTNED